MEVNEQLAEAMRELGLEQVELARRINAEIYRFTGRPGTVSDRNVRYWLTGKTRWPHKRQRLAIEAVFGCSAEQLGFRPPQSACSAPAAPDDREVPLQRRSFLAAATATAAALTPAGSASAAPRIGHGDVVRLRSRLADLAASDDRHGGNLQLEYDALAEAQHALDLLQNAQASERVRNKIYSVVSDAYTTAAWAAIDSRELGRAQGHLDHALSLAGLSSDGAALLRAWNNVAMLASHRGRYVDAYAAARAGQKTSAARRDPLYLSLCQARGALAQASAGDAQGALRATGHAEESLGRAAAEDRPAWIRFYDEAELHGLASLVHMKLGQNEKAEYHVHYALSRLHPDLRRNRAYYTAQLALAQIRQGDLDQACHTADTLMTAGLPGSARVRELLQDFRTEAAATGSAKARTWLNDTSEGTLAHGRRSRSAARHQG